MDIKAIILFITSLLFFVVILYEIITSEHFIWGYTFVVFLLYTELVVMVICM